MITKIESLLDVLGASGAQLIVPVYQRVYAWGEAQCGSLWEDVLRAGKTGREHFLGTVLYAEGRDAASRRRVVDLVDGQQRLVTASLMIAALRDYLLEEGKTLDYVDAEALANRYLRFADDDGEGCDEANPCASSSCKLLLSCFDRATMQALVYGEQLPEEDERSQNVVANYQMFRSRMSGEFDAELLWRGLNLLTVISAELEEGDRPQLVFESLNSKGKPLSTADLVRNLLFAHVGLEEQEYLHERYWAPLEALFGEGLDSLQFTAALRGWLALKAAGNGKCGSGDVYSAFKAYVETEYAGSVEDLLFALTGYFHSFVTRSQSEGARIAGSHNTYGVAKVEGIVSEKKLFGD